MAKNILDRTRAPVSDDVTKTRRISTVDHCRSSRAWEQTGTPDNRPTNERTAG